MEQAIITRRPNDFRLVGVPEKRVIDQEANYLERVYPIINYSRLMIILLQDFQALGFRGEADVFKNSLSSSRLELPRLAK